MNKKFSNSSKGNLFVVSGPSGVGKTVLCTKVLERIPRLVYSISVTSREPRGGEKDGQEYFFISCEQFEDSIKEGKFAEWAEVHGNYYGTPKLFLDEQMNNGNHVVLNIDVQGAMKIKASYPQAVMIFISPPSFEILEKRLRKRNVDSEGTLQRRLANAQKEVAFQNEYTHNLVNDDLESSISQLETIMRKYIQCKSV